MTIALLILAAVLVLAALACGWAWLICLGRGAERLAARPAAIFAVVLLDTGWRPVPRARILRQASPDLSSHVCANLTTEEIYCFVPGPQGS